MSKYLVAGAGGFIGGHLVSSLLNDGHEVVCAESVIPDPNTGFNTLMMVLCLKTWKLR